WKRHFNWRSQMLSERVEIQGIASRFRLRACFLTFGRLRLLSVAHSCDLCKGGVVRLQQKTEAGIPRLARNDAGARANKLAAFSGSFIASSLRRGGVLE